jgi:hypothetical protein
MALKLDSRQNKQYYTDGKQYFWFYQVGDPKIAITDFLCIILGIPKRAGFTPAELARINSWKEKTTFQLLKKPFLSKDFVAERVRYRDGYPDVRQGDTLLAPFKCLSCTSDTVPGPKCTVCGEPL